MLLYKSGNYRRFLWERACSRKRCISDINVSDVPYSRAGSLPPGIQYVDQNAALPTEAPPSTNKVCPVMKPLCSDNRNAIAEAISSGCPSRPIGTPARYRASPSLPGAIQMFGQRPANAFAGAGDEESTSGHGNSWAFNRVSHAMHPASLQARDAECNRG